RRGRRDSKPSWVDRVVPKIPPPLRGIVERAQEDDILLFASGLAFYAVVSVVPLTILVMWVVSLVLGDPRLHQLADQIGRLGPKKLGADQALRRVADLGSRIGIVAIVTGLWPATSYGSGLERAFVRLGPKRGEELPGLRGRALFFLVLMPVFILGSLLGSYAGSRAVTSAGFGKAAGYALALGAGFIGAGAALVLIYRIFPPERLPW